MDWLKFIEMLAKGSPQFILAAAVLYFAVSGYRREKDMKQERMEFKAADAAEREKLMALIKEGSAINANATTAMNRASNAIEHCIRSQGRNENTYR